MPASDRSDGGPSGRKPGSAEPEAGPAPPIERSSRGRIIVRSSSHPPGADAAVGSGDVSGARALPGAPSTPARTKRDTPAERPRLRRQAKAAGPPERARRDSPPGQRLGAPSRESRPGPPPRPLGSWQAAQPAQGAENAPPSVEAAGARSAGSDAALQASRGEIGAARGAPSGARRIVIAGVGLALVCAALWVWKLLAG